MSVYTTTYCARDRDARMIAISNLAGPSLASLHSNRRQCCLPASFRVQCSSDATTSGTIGINSSTPPLPRSSSILQNIAPHFHKLRAPLASLVKLTQQQQQTNGSITSQILGASALSFVAPACWTELWSNYIFTVGFWGWFSAQFLKIFTKWFKTGTFSLLAFVDSGGMPSSHSSLCSAVTTAVALQQGLSSPLFAVCVCFSVIVMYDAMGVRRHAGLQAEVLNAVVKDLLEGHPMSEKKLKEVLGHTPRQVLCGAALGIGIGLLYPRF